MCKKLCGFWKVPGARDPLSFSEFIIEIDRFVRSESFGKGLSAFFFDDLLLGVPWFISFFPSGCFVHLLSFHRGKKIKGINVYTSCIKLDELSMVDNSLYQNCCLIVI